MKKVLKRKLFIINGCTKNYFLWEVPQGRGVMFEIIEEFKGRRIARALLRGYYSNKLQAFVAFKKIIDIETARMRGAVATPQITLQS